MIFVTGATGFLGKALVQTLLVQGHQVRIFVRPTSDVSLFRNIADLEIAVGDITDLPSIEKGISGCEAVIHAAALFRFWGKRQDFETSNVLGTENILRACQQQQIKRLVLISSIAVVGQPPEGLLITETTPLNPVDPYQKSKHQSELVAQKYFQTFGIDVVIVRLGALYGPGGHYAFNRLFFEEFLRGWRIKVEGGKHITFPCFVEDAAHGIEAALTLGRGGEIYNICGESISHNDLNQLISCLSERPGWRINMPKWLMIATASMLELVAKLTNREPFYPLNLKNYVFSDWIVSCDKAKRELHFEPTPIQNGIKKTLDWYQNLGLK